LKLKQRGSFILILLPLKIMLWAVESPDCSRSEIASFLRRIKQDMRNVLPMIGIQRLLSRTMNLTMARSDLRE
jgi:hypothetical protein